MMKLQHQQLHQWHGLIQGDAFSISFKTFSATYLSSGHLQHSAVSAFSLHLIIWVLLCSTIKSHWLLLQSANKEARMWRPLWQKRDIFGANPTFHNTLLTKLERESVFFPTCGTTLLLTRVFRCRSGPWYYTTYSQNEKFPQIIRPDGLIAMLPIKLL